APGGMTAAASLLAGIHEPGGVSDREAATPRIRAAFGDPAVPVRFAGDVAAAAAAAGAAGDGGRVAWWLDGEIDEVAGSAPAAPDDLEPRLAAQPVGEDTVAGWRGAFAVLAWDNASGRGILARDHVGERSVYMATEGPRLLFASELRALLRMLPTRPAPDDVAVAQWLSSGSIAGSRTLHSGVERLLPGHAVMLSPSGRRTVSYWSPRYVEPVATPLEEVGAGLRDLLGRAIARRRRGDQPLGVLLSGGLDSTSVAALATTLGDVTGYTAALPDHPGVDESQLVAALARGVPLSLATAEVRSPSAFPTALEYLAAWELPLTGPGALFEFPLAQLAARDGLGLLIDGQGGDELFGASPYLIADAVRAGRPRRVLDLARVLAGGGASPRELGAVVMRQGLRPALPHGVHRVARRIRPPRRYGAAWLSDEAARAVARTDDAWDWKRPGGAPRWWAAQLDLMTGLRERFGVQEYVRHRGASAGLRSRSPLLDPDLVESMLAVAPELAFRSALGRPALREAVRGLSPDPVRLREGKSDLSPFLHQSVAGAGSDAIAALLREPGARARRYVRPDALERILARTRVVEPGSLPLAIALWRIGNMELWLRLQEDPAFPERFLGASGIPRSEIRIVRSERR
ncbi:MAG: hypothetical protein QOJ12_1812, partial [Thermoleophilales bacterium]|nr:hypothetical protein [Thermoleophilales bacterium]